MKYLWAVILWVIAMFVVSGSVFLSRYNNPSHKLPSEYHREVVSAMPEGAVGWVSPLRFALDQDFDFWIGSTAEYKKVRDSYSTVLIRREHFGVCVEESTLPTNTFVPRPTHPRYMTPARLCEFPLWFNTTKP